MFLASFNGVDLALIAAALLGAVLVMYCLRKQAENPVTTVRDRDPLDEVFRGELAFELSPRVFDQERARTQ